MTLTISMNLLSSELTVLGVMMQLSNEIYILYGSVYEVFFIKRRSAKYLASELEMSKIIY